MKRRPEHDRPKTPPSPAVRKQAMLAWIGTRRDWPGEVDTDAYLRDLRKGHRLERLRK